MFSTGPPDINTGWPNKFPHLREYPTYGARTPFETSPVWAIFCEGKDCVMKKPTKKLRSQPEPVTPGITKGMVRQRALELYRDRLLHESLTTEDWVLAEKDLVQSMETDGLLKR